MNLIFINFLGRIPGLQKKTALHDCNTGFIETFKMSIYQWAILFKASSFFKFRICIIHPVNLNVIDRSVHRHLSFEWFRPDCILIRPPLSCVTMFFHLMVHCRGETNTICLCISQCNDVLSNRLPA